MPGIEKLGSSWIWALSGSRRYARTGVQGAALHYPPPSSLLLPGALLPLPPRPADGSVHVRSTSRSLSAARAAAPSGSHPPAECSAWQCCWCGPPASPLPRVGGAHCGAAGVCKVALVFPPPPLPLDAPIVLCFFGWVRVLAVSLFLSLVLSDGLLSPPLHPLTHSPYAPQGPGDSATRAAAATGARDMMITYLFHSSLVRGASGAPAESNRSDPCPRCRPALCHCYLPVSAVSGCLYRILSIFYWSRWSLLQRVSASFRPGSLMVRHSAQTGTNPSTAGCRRSSTLCGIYAVYRAVGASPLRHRAIAVG